MDRPSLLHGPTSPPLFAWTGTPPCFYGFSARWFCHTLQVHTAPSLHLSLFLEETFLHTLIYKEGLSRTVVREVLPRATAHGHQTFPDYGRHTRSRSKGGDVREEAPAEECAAKNLQTTVRHLGFTEEIYGFPRTLLCCQYKRGAPTVVRELLPRASTKSDQTFPAVARCTSHQYKVVDVLK